MSCSTIIHIFGFDTRSALPLAEKCGVAFQLTNILRDIWEDVQAGHVTVIAELVGASLARPELRAELLERMQPWLALVADVLREVAGDSPLAELVPLEDAASALVALYFGLNLLSRLDPESAQAESLFDLMERVAPLLS